MNYKRSRQTFAWLAETIRAARVPGPLRLVGVDGRAGSGKSTFARRLSESLGGAPILALDDFLSWDDLTEFWPRLEAQALQPLFQGRDARYQVRDWEADPFGRKLGLWKQLPFAPVVIIEGVGSARRQIRSRLAYAVWVETPASVCLQRGALRDGPERMSLWTEWQAREAGFFEADPVRDSVDLIVDGQGDLDETQAELVLLSSAPP